MSIIRTADQLCRRPLKRPLRRANLYQGL